jgi:hypothetical protein
MAVVNRMELGRELMRTLSQVGRQMESLEKEAKKRDVSPYDLRDPMGNYMLPPLLSAKAQLLHALALVNQKDQS